MVPSSTVPDEDTRPEQIWPAKDKPVSDAYTSRRARGAGYTGGMWCSSHGRHRNPASGGIAYRCGSNDSQPDSTAHCAAACYADAHPCSYRCTHHSANQYTKCTTFASSA